MKKRKAQKNICDYILGRVVCDADLQDGIAVMNKDSSIRNKLKWLIHSSPLIGEEVCASIQDALTVVLELEGEDARSQLEGLLKHTEKCAECTDFFIGLILDNTPQSSFEKSRILDGYPNISIQLKSQRKKFLQCE